MKLISKVKNSFFLILGLSLCSIFLANCAGYQLGGAQPQKYRHIKNISVPHAKNLTFEPKLSALFTGTIIDRISQDGTYKVTTANAADATLNLSVNKLSYRQYTSSRFDTSASSELENRLLVNWKLVSNNKVIGQGSVTGGINFFVAENLETARQNALPLAAEDAAEKIIFELTQGF